MKIFQSFRGKAVLLMLLCLLMLWGCGASEDDVPAVTTTGPTDAETTAPTAAATVPETSPVTEPQLTEPVLETTAPVTEPLQETAPVTEPVQETVPVETTAPVTEPVPETTAPAETTVPPTVATESTQPSAPAKEPADDEFVRVVDYIPDVVVDLKYATEDNICGKVVYHFTDAYLRYGTVKKLAAVQMELASMGYGLKIWDAYRPVKSQYEIWLACPDPTYVAPPQRGYSAHCRGCNVDLTIVDKRGNELEMPSGFDEFNAQGDRDYSDCSATAAKNSQMLEDLMVKHGFKPHSLEWWQYTDTFDYGIEEEFLSN